MNKCVLVCHCLLDPLTRAEGTKEIARDIIKVFIDRDVNVIQLPCPELIYGFFRPPCNKEDYDTPEYRKHCRKIAEKICETVEKYPVPVGLVSIGGSPSCGYQRTHVKGEHVNAPGIFIEELQSVFKTRGVSITISDHELLTSEGEIDSFLSTV